MSVKLPTLIEYLTLLSKLEDGQELHFGDVIVKRMDGRIWESVFVVEEEEYIDEETIEGEE